MSLDFRNVNTLWASVLVETLVRLGMTDAAVCPGSRSTPLTVALAQHPKIHALPILDERSAAFYALGRSRQTHRPTLLVCTSGTAGANMYPAVIEARESGVPLIVLTADRPPELRHCNSGQTIDQQKLYGTYPNWYGELALPSTERPMLDYLRQTLCYAWERSLFPVAGPVHLNQPLRDPLAPTPDSNVQFLKKYFNEANFFAAVDASVPIAPSLLPGYEATLPLPPDWQTNRGIIIAGIDHPYDAQAYCEAIAHLAIMLGFPVLAEGLSPVRNYADCNAHLVTTYDGILRHSDWKDDLAPDVVIRIGEMPTSKVLRRWLQEVRPLQWVVHEGDRNLDPTHGRTRHLRASVHTLARSLTTANPQTKTYLHRWLAAETLVRQTIDQRMETDALIESRVTWGVGRSLPPETPIMIANSTPVRDVEWFWPPNAQHHQIFFNRGANGIEGTLSTALGICGDRPGVLITGDLACLHDTNGFLLQNHWRGHLTVIVINNQGGGIFGLLPIAEFEPPFEDFFLMPQSVDFATLCAAYGVPHHRITAWEQLTQLLNPLPQSGIRVLELPTHRQSDLQWRRDLWQELEALSIPSLS